MSWEDIKGLKLYLLICSILICIYAYSAATGWKWFNPTKTEPVRPTGTSRYIYRYHK